MARGLKTGQAPGPGSRGNLARDAERNPGLDLKPDSKPDPKPDSKPDSKPNGRRRRVLWLALVVGVLVVHGFVTLGVVDRLAAVDTDRSMPARMEVTYVREMKLAAPPPTAAPAAPSTVVAQASIDAPPVLRRPEPRAKVAKPKIVNPKVVKPPKVAKAASVPESAPDAAALAAASSASRPSSPSQPPQPSDPKADEPVVAAASAAPVGAQPAAVDGESGPAVSAASAADSAAAMPQLAAAPTIAAGSAGSAAFAASAAASGPAVPFAWPASTRLSYVLTGNYRGEVQGSAQVEWVRSGSHYQVHVDFLVGPEFAPLITQRSTSDGEITAAGLAPRRYDQDVRLLFSTRPRQTVLFDHGYVVLANGDVREALPGLQDTASQFVQLAYMFGTRPDLLRIGGRVDIPLALPKKVAVWTYDVVDEQVLQTGFGPVNAIHLVPHDKQQRAGSLSVEMWLAPQLRYLPVRLRFEQNDSTYVDLLLSKPPEIAG